MGCGKGKEETYGSNTPGQRGKIEGVFSKATMGGKLVGTIFHIVLEGNQRTAA